jgi:hypothetical protein
MERAKVLNDAMQQKMCFVHYSTFLESRIVLSFYVRHGVTCQCDERGAAGGGGDSVFRLTFIVGCRVYFVSDREHTVSITKTDWLVLLGQFCLFVVRTTRSKHTK